MTYNDYIVWILGFILILSALGVILIKKPVHASLSFLVTLLTLAAFYIELHAEFISVMQIIVYAGAILVIFMFVIILFQDAYLYIDKYPSQSSSPFLILSAAAFVFALGYYGKHLLGVIPSKANLPEGFGSVQVIGKALYLDFFFPFEAVVLLFLIALIGSIYIGRKVT